VERLQRSVSTFLQSATPRKNKEETGLCRQSWALALTFRKIRPLEKLQNYAASVRLRDNDVSCV
jgi:hypothetical protein